MKALNLMVTFIFHVRKSKRALEQNREEKRYGMAAAYSNSDFCWNIRVILYCEMGSKRCIKRIF